MNRLTCPLFYEMKRTTFALLLSLAAVTLQPYRCVLAEAHVAMSGRIVNVPIAESPADAIPSDRYHSVFQSTLSQMPVIVELGMATYESDTSIGLYSEKDDWLGNVLLVVERDGVLESGYSVRPLHELVIQADRVARGDWTEARRNAKECGPNEAFRAYCAISGPNGTTLVPGRYRITLRFESRAQEFFGLSVRCFCTLGLEVKEDPGESKNQHTEDFIERYYLWALSLYKFDRMESTKHFDRAWELCRDYLRRGAGDEADLWNITPRLQAAAISGWLDRPKDKISYLSQLLSKSASAVANGKVCKMRFYHYRRERGHLPRNVRDDLTRDVNRLYERVYGKTMSGRALSPQVPLRKKFPDEASDSQGE